MCSSSGVLRGYSGRFWCNPRSSPRNIGDVAQSEEHLLCKQGVGGSSPLVSTDLRRKRRLSNHLTRLAVRGVTVLSPSLAAKVLYLGPEPVVWNTPSWRLGRAFWDDLGSLETIQETASELQTSGWQGPALSALSKDRLHSQVGFVCATRRLRLRWSLRLIVHVQTSRITKTTSAQADRTHPTVHPGVL